MKTRLSLVRGDLLTALGHVSDEMLAWAPAEGMRTVDGQIREIAQTELQIMGLLKTGDAPTFESVAAQVRRDSVAGYRELLDQVRADTVTWIDSQTDEQLDATVAVPGGWFEALGLENTPKSEVLRSLAAHEWYHVGQLVSYLWFRGDNPYRWG